MAYAKPVRITSEAVEKNIRVSREADERQRSLEAFSKESASLLSAANAQYKIESQRRVLKQQVCKTEKQQEEELQYALYQKKMRELTITQNQALANALDKDTADVERRQREIQKICEEAPELKELEHQLKIAYLNKERAAQHEEKVLLAAKEQERISAIEDEMENFRLMAIENEANKHKGSKADHERHRDILQQQMDEKRQQLEEAKRTMERERQMVDEIIDKINREDNDSRYAKREAQEKNARMVRGFEDQRQRELAAARKKAQDDEDEINAYQKAMEDRGAGVAAKKQAKKEEEDRIFKAIAEEAERKRLETEEFNGLRDMLWEEELEAKRAADAKAKIDLQNSMRRDMMVANEQMMRHKEVMRNEQAAQEARLVSIMRQKFANDEAKEQQEDAYKKSIKMHHMTLLEKQRIERKDMYEAERAQEYAIIDENNRREEYRKNVIHEARARLLDQHAAALGSHMPNKAFQNQDEMENFRAAGSTYGRK